ncbi:hypothetical protein DF150_13785 [Burkholderia cenocepacia]|nr:hypothetical protein DF150_13785 [Burkholderia cenocepacia]
MTRVGNLLRARDCLHCQRRISCVRPAGQSPRFRLRRTFHRERGEWIVGSQYPCSKRNIGTTL